MTARGQAVWPLSARLRPKVTAPVTTGTIFSVRVHPQAVHRHHRHTGGKKGLVELDRPIPTYLPAFKVNSVFEDRTEEQVAPRHLLSNAAGFTHEAPEESNYRVGRRSFTTHCRSISETWLRFRVGHHFEYSNLGIDTTYRGPLTPRLGTSRSIWSRPS